MRIDPLNKHFLLVGNCWSDLPESEMKRIKPEFIAKYRKKSIIQEDEEKEEQ